MNNLRYTLLSCLTSLILVSAMVLHAQETGIGGTVASWSPDSRYLAVGDADGTVNILELASDTVVYSFEGDGTPVHSVAWSSIGDAIASGDANGTIYLWEPFTGEIIATLTGHTGIVNTLDWNLTGRMLASGSDDGTLRVWDVEETNEILSVPASRPVTTVDWSPDGKQIAYSGGGAYDVIRAPVLVGLRAHAGADQTIISRGGAPVTVILDGSWSQATVGDIGSYAWRIKGEVVGTGVHPQITLEPGTHTIELTIFNDYIRSDTDEVVIDVIDQALISIGTPETE
jgi:WD40 repeat protein